MSTSEQPMSTMSDILLVGSDGYIGSNTPLVADGIDLKTGTDFLEIEIKEYKTIVFLAARLEPTPEDYAYNERLYDKLDKWVAEYPDTHVIYASSAAVYGEGFKSHKENDYLVPLNLYGMGKLLGEYHVREYPKHTVFRFSNVYGKAQGLPGHGVTEAFEKGGNEIYGDGEQTRDFIHVNELWRYICSAVNHPDKWQGVFNLASGESKSINEWFKIHGTGKPNYKPAREGDIYDSALDNAKAVERLEQCR